MISRFKEIRKTKSGNCSVNKKQRLDAKNICQSIQYTLTSLCNRGKTFFVYIDVLSVLLFFVCANMVDHLLVQSCASRLWLIVAIVCN